jgi:hypothetical protein
MPQPTDSVMGAKFKRGAQISAGMQQARVQGRRIGRPFTDKVCQLRRRWFFWSNWRRSDPDLVPSVCPIALLTGQLTLAQRWMELLRASVSGQNEIFYARLGRPAAIKPTTG